MLDDDFLEQQIQVAARSLSMLLLNKDMDLHLSDRDDELWKEAAEMVAQGEINAAEDLVLDEVESAQDMDALEMAIAFYSEINRLTDKQLAVREYSREEIRDGLEQLKEIYGVEF